MSHSAFRTLIAFEMNLLLGPLTLVVLCAMTTSVALGFPLALGVVAGPSGRHDETALCLGAMLILLLLALWMAWTLGVITVRGERYRFEGQFWLALGYGIGAAWLASRYVMPLGWLVMAPVWLFVVHMSAVQLWRRGPVKSSTRSAS